MKRKVYSLLLCLICVLALLPAQALAAAAIDTGRSVSLTLEYKQDETPVPGVQFDLYRVADVDEYASFTLSGDFASYPVSLSGLDTDGWRALAGTLSSYADRDGLTPLDTGKTGTDGRLAFPTGAAALTPGLYLAVGRQLTYGGYVYTTEPFLLSLPNLDTESDSWTYDVTAEPKFTREKLTEPGDGDTVERRVIKIWKDDDEASRPREVTVQLLRDGSVCDTVKLSKANSWRYSWSKLPKTDKNGKRIFWSLTEAEPDGYTVLISREGVTFTVTNTPEENELTSRTVLKVWDDEGSEDKRPESIRVTLLKDGKTYDSRTLSESDRWQYSWRELPRYENGREIEWTVQEDKVEGYVGTVKQSGGTFVITNRPGLPYTGQLWWPVPLLAVCGLGLVAGGVLLLRRQRRGSAK